MEQEQAQQSSLADSSANTRVITKRRGNPQNLRPHPPWKPGESGNPSGRPKSKPITDAYNRALSRKECDLIAKAMLRQAKKGNVKATVEMTDRTEGKLQPDEPKQTPISVIVVPITVNPTAELKDAT